MVEERGNPMDNIIAWNIRSLNWPNKQEDLKAFLHANKVGMIGLMKTKIKMTNDRTVAAKAFPGCRWDNNSTPPSKEEYGLHGTPELMMYRFYRKLSNSFTAMLLK